MKQKLNFFVDLPEDVCICAKILFAILIILKLNPCSFFILTRLNKSKENFMLEISQQSNLSPARFSNSSVTSKKMITSKANSRNIRYLISYYQLLAWCRFHSKQLVF